MIEDPQQIQSKIMDLKEMKAKYLKEVKKYKTESGMKLEETARFLEKKNALSKEAKDRQARQLQLEENLKAKLEQARLMNKDPAAKNAKETFDNSEEQEKLKEKFTSLLENNFNQPIGAYIKDYYTQAYTYQFEADEESDKAYSKSGIIHTIAVYLEEDLALQKDDDDDEKNYKTQKTKDETVQYVTTFRLTPSTKNAELIKAACDFWGKVPEEYEAADEKGAKFETKEVMASADANTLERFWKSRRNENNQLMIVMKRKKRDADQNKKDQEEKERKLEIVDEEDEGQASQNGVYQSYHTLLPKLKKYINITRAQVTDKEKAFEKMNNPVSFGENHFCIVFIIAVLLVNMLLSVMLHRNLLNEYFTLSNIEKSINLTAVAGINSMDTFLDEMLNNIGNYFPQTFDEEPVLGGASATLKLYHPILIRLYRVNKKTCDFPLRNVDCYYDFYSRDTRNTSDFNDTNIVHTFSYYKGEKPINGTVEGLFGNYDLEAYITSYDPRNTTTWQFARGICTLFANKDSLKTKCDDFFAGQPLEDSEIDELKTNLSKINSMYVDGSTRALRTSLYLFEVTSSTFIGVDLMAEVTPAGTLMAYVTRATVFRPNLKEDTQVPQNALNIIIVIFNTFLLLFVIYNLFTSGNGGINLAYFITLQGLLNALIIVFCYFVHNRIDKLNGYEVTRDQLLSDSTLTSVNDLMNLYEQIFIFKSIAIALMVIRLALIFKLNTKIDTIVTALQNSIPHIALTTICAAPIILSSSFLCHYMLGPQNYLFNGYGKSLSAVLVLVTGNQGTMLTEYTVVENLMIIIGFFFLFFMLLSIFSAVSVENYRLTLLDYGQEYHTKFTWKPEDYVKWLFSWVPNRIKNTKNQLKLNNLKLGDKLNNLKLGEKLKIDFDATKVTGFLAKAKGAFKKGPKSGKKKTNIENEEQ